MSECLCTYAQTRRGCVLFLLRLRRRFRFLRTISIEIVSTWLYNTQLYATVPVSVELACIVVVLSVTRLVFWQ